MKKEILKKSSCIVATIIFSIALTGCFGGKKSEKEKEKPQVDIEKPKEEGIFKEIDALSSWVTYWDLKVDEEINLLGQRLKELSYFAVYYDENQELVLPKDLVDFYSDAPYKDKRVNYITIVNDEVNSDGTSKVKDKELLHSLLMEENIRSTHIEEIINLALDNDFQGIEMDYENLKKDEELWDNYLLFIEELYKEAKEKNLKVKVVLEPSAPIEDLDFPEGPTYVMMCYNLHGGFSEPGPKATPDFIKELILKMEKVPGEKSFAIATGGFDWGDNGKVLSLTEKGAKELIKTYGVSVTRDEESKCNVFNYEDQEGVSHEVWYADLETLNEWMKVIKENSGKVSIWRLGHNSFKFD